MPDTGRRDFQFIKPGSARQHGSLVPRSLGPVVMELPLIKRRGCGYHPFMDACAKESAAMPKAYVCPVVVAAASRMLCLSGGCALKLLDNLFHVLMAQVTTVVITTVSVLVFNFRPSLEFFLEAPSVLLSILICNARNPQGVEYAPREERIRGPSGTPWERSSGAAEELERLTKPKSDTEPDEDTF